MSNSRSTALSVMKKAERLAPRVHVALLAQRNHLLHMRTHRLGLGHGGLHAVFHDDGRDQVAQQRAAMAGVASEFESCIAMAHGETLFRISDQCSGVRDQNIPISMDRWSF